MKNLIVYLSFFVCCKVAISQSYVYTPFPENRAYWSMIYNDPLQPPFRNEGPAFEMVGDTLISGISYNKIYLRLCQYSDTFLLLNNKKGYVGALRQDIAAKTVYFVDKDSSNEGLLYDFSKIIVGGKYPPTLHHVDTNLIITKRDSITDDLGNLRWKYVITDTARGISNNIIEGIGFQGGYSIVPKLNNFPVLIYFEVDFKSVWHSIGSKCDYALGVVEKELVSEFSKVFVYPNPAHDEFTFSFKESSPDDFDNLQLSVYDVTGSLVKQERVTSSSQSFQRKDLPTGFYIWSLQCGSKQLGIGKLVLE
jgi:hypothetical protein